MSITIRDVAKLAGVSVSTVSLVLNNKSYVSPETKTKVLVAAKKLGYAPSAIARKFTTGKTNTIGLYAFVSHEHPLGGFFMPIILGILKAIEKTNYAFQLDIKGEDKEGRLNKKEILSKVAKEKMLDGLLILSHWPLHFEEISSLVESKFPFVIIDGKVSDHYVNCVEIDNFGGACKAVEHLIKLGHRRIGHIAGPEKQPSAKARLEGYLETLRRYKIPVDERLIYYGDFHKQSGYEGMKKILNLPISPSAVFVANDNMCLAGMKAIQEKGLSIPEDIALIGFDDIELSAHSRPPLTTVLFPRFDLGKRAGELLLKVMKEKGLSKPERIVLGTKLIIRESCRALRVK